MKVLQKISSLILVSTVLFAATSCSNDDNNTLEDLTTLSGDYAGYTSGTFKYSPTPIVRPDETVNLSVTSDGKATVTFNSDTWGKTTITDASVVLENGTYSISGKGKATAGMGNSQAQEYDCTLTGTISGDKKTVDLKFVYPYMGGTTVTFAQGEAPAKDVVAGSYDGYVKAVFKYAPDGIITDGEKVAITANEDGTVKVVYTSNTEAQYSWGTTTIESATVTRDGDNYKLEGTGKSLLGMHGGATKDYDCKFSGTISKDGESVSFIITVQAVMGGTTITFTQGDAPTTTTSGQNLGYYLQKYVFNK